MSGGGWKQVLDPIGLSTGADTGDFGNVIRNHLDPVNAVHNGDRGDSYLGNLIPKDQFDPAGLYHPLTEDTSPLGQFTRSYGLNDPLNIGGNGGLNTAGHTAYTDNLAATKADDATRNAPLPALNLPRTNGGLGQYQPRPVVMPHLLPQQQSRSGNMPYLRNRAFGQVLAPLQQQNWGLPQVNPAFLTGINQVSGGQIPNGQINLPPPRGGLQYQVPDPSQPMRKWM